MTSVHQPDSAHQPHTVQGGNQRPASNVQAAHSGMELPPPIKSSEPPNVLAAERNYQAGAPEGSQAAAPSLRMVCQHAKDVSSLRGFHAVLDMIPSLEKDRLSTHPLSILVGRIRSLPTPADQKEAVAALRKHVPRWDISRLHSRLAAEEKRIEKKQERDDRRALDGNSSGNDCSLLRLALGCIIASAG